MQETLVLQITESTLVVGHVALLTQCLSSTYEAVRKTERAVEQL